MTGGPPKPAETHEQVASEWPPICVATERDRRRVSDLVAVIATPALWFSPKRVGPIVAAASWRATLIAHAIAVCLGVGLIAWAEHIAMFRAVFKPAFPPGWPIPPFSFSMPDYGGATGLEWLRSPFAALVTNIHGSGTFVVSGLTLPWAFVGLELGVVVAALLIAPFIAAGETTRLVLRRCVKLSLWSTTMLLPLGVGWLLVPYTHSLLGLPKELHSIDFAALSLFSVWWLTVLLRSGSTYVGPAKGPLWEPRCPRCESCGYSIAYLDVAGRCPECARPVAMSMADRRRVPDFARAVGLSGKTRGLFSTLRSAIAEKSFFAGLAVQRGHRDARIFFILVAAIGSGVLCVAPTVREYLLSPGDRLGGGVAEFVIIACRCFFIQIAFATVLVWVIALLGKRPLYAAATVVFYGWAWVLPAVLAFVFLFVAALVLGWAVDSRIGFVGTSVASLTIAVAFVGAGLLLRSSVRIIRSALKDTRFANG